MINIAIIDDELVFTNELHDKISSYLLKSDKEFKIMEYQSPEKYVIDVFKNKSYYHIVFMDIDMPNINGIELSKKMYEAGLHSIVIFVTSKENYVYDAYGLNVFGFICKRDINRFLKKKLFDCFHHISKYEKIEFRYPEGSLCLFKTDISYIEMIDRKIYLHTLNDKYQIYYKVLSDLQDRLGSSFFLINRNCIVNLEHIKLCSDYVIINDNNNTYLDISKNKIKKLKEAYLTFNLEN